MLHQFSCELCTRMGKIFIALFSFVNQWEDNPNLRRGFRLKNANFDVNYNKRSARPFTPQQASQVKPHCVTTGCPPELRLFCALDSENWGYSVFIRSCKPTGQVSLFFLLKREAVNQHHTHT